MERLFRTHYVRKQECLDGTWEFQTVEEYALPANYTDRMAVPACWEMSMPYCKYSGCGAYRRSIYVERDSNIRLVFKFPQLFHSFLIVCLRIQIRFTCCD